MGSNRINGSADPALERIYTMLGPAMAGALQRHADFVQMAQAVREHGATPAELHDVLLVALKAACADNTLSSDEAPSCPPRFSDAYTPYRQMDDAAINDLAEHLSVAMLDARKGKCRGIDTSQLHEATKPQSLWHR